MGLQTLMPKVMGFLIVIITLALAPTINTENATIIASNLTNCIGMTAIAAFGAPLIILGLLIGGGIFAVAGTRGLLAGATIRDMLEIIGAVVFVIVALSLFSNIITYTNTLIDASSGFAVTIYGIIPIVIYVGIIAASGWTQVQAYRRVRKGRGRGRATAQV